ncbi:Rne/Rng family ribonuclease [Mesorhizobium sp. ZC-5]|uniref:Rne/Rng family ribonuclease n=1 Tax=Mesorhizobium sp. ZC-5 TaxID=2986066 RepID=UPI0021E6E3BF|nr:Rne/Rng family ribonuclease [Mesorhizobium sp. ZC-5]MCV3241329.1 Rne/Rng family ribonuclease [Mesorhizobium sp. ZC-5]
MPNKMLIDASHPEETRVVVVRGNRIEEFDFESQDKKQLKGNIYLARVTRVEPSLQAAFVEYGGNRHGFLAFSEIHPDYYQIPVADRQALLRAEAEEAEAEDDEDSDGEERQDRNRSSNNRRRRRGGKNRGRDEHRANDANGDNAGDEAEETAGQETEAAASDDVEASGSEDAVGTSQATASDESEAAQAETPQQEASPEAEASEESDDQSGSDENEGRGPTSMAAAIDADVISEPVPDSKTDAEASESEARGVIEEVHGSHGDDHEVESVGAEDALEEVRNRRKPARRNYKIQEVIKRRQILLVQVVKEERGNKGAALTTYLSLAGRYSVLMPNTARGGGISRKITNAQDRKRLKEVVQDLAVPQGMGVILRTAGESRTKAEIKRDYEYLMRMWETVRNTTLQSTAPSLVYEEGSLIKRSVRDLYNKDIDEVLVAGDEGYREAKDFMRMLMPSHAKVVQPYRDTTPIFARNGIEAQLDRMLQPQVTLKSGGYIIINQTEALVSIDVNSGRSTKEHSIEDTALQTNLEAAEEVARQLRLRDLAGLIVIDFIDMEENRNNRSVEKRLKDHLKNDRARIQVGRISHFGLLEMSRQRIRASVLESTMKPCPHCGGTGHVRSDSSVALLVVRAIEEFLLKDSRSHITVRTPAATAMYVLNHKRAKLVELETRFAVTITLEPDETVGSQHYAIFRGALAEKPAGWTEALLAPATPEIEPDETDEIEVVEEEDEAIVEAVERPARPEHRGEEGDRGHDHKRKRRRRRRGGRDRDREREHAAPNEGASVATAAPGNDEAENTAIEAGSAETLEAQDSGEDAAGDHKKRRRGKRGGKRNRKDEAAGEEAGEISADSEVETVEAIVIEAEPAPTAEETPVEKPKKPRRTAKSKKAEAEAAAAAAVAEVVSAESAAEPIAIEPEPAPAAAEPVAEEAKPRQRATRRKAEPKPSDAPPVPVVSSTAASDEEAKPKKAGWWQRKSFF